MCFFISLCFKRYYFCCSLLFFYSCLVLFIFPLVNLTDINIAVLFFFCNLVVWFHDIRCVASTPPDSNCTFNWVQYRPAYGGRGSEHQSTGYTLTDCQNACEFDPRCVAVEWLSIDGDCWINAITNHVHQEHRGETWRTHGAHYDLVSRCNLTAGQYFHVVLMVR